MTIDTQIVVNDRTYPAAKSCVITICLDGCEPAYLDVAIADGLMPCLQRMRQETGTDRLAHAVVPTFTNPNNLSIATGQPPIVHGICGNYLFDPETGQEVMMNDVRFLRVPTIFSTLHDAGGRVAIVTAKDKLRALLGAGLHFDDGRAICFSSEKSDQTTQAENGIDNASQWLGLPVPDVYSAELSECVFAAGVQLMRDWSPDIMYLTTSDYVQHKAAPDDNRAKAFYVMFDSYLAELDSMGAVIVITADHGMKPKHNASGQPNVIYAQDLLDSWLGTSIARVILPITDPYVVHHGALGAFATAYLPQDIDTDDVIHRLRNTIGMMLVIDREEAVKRFQLPGDRIGDIVMISDENTVIGTSVERHDLAALEEPLRSHGGLTEQEVPFIINRKIDLPNAPVLRNFDAYFYATTASSQGTPS